MANVCCSPGPRFALPPIGSHEERQIFQMQPQNENSSLKKIRSSLLNAMGDDARRCLHSPVGIVPVQSCFVSDQTLDRAHLISTPTSEKLMRQRVYRTKLTEK